MEEHTENKEETPNQGKTKKEKKPKKFVKKLDKILCRPGRSCHRMDCLFINWQDRCRSGNP